MTLVHVVSTSTWSAPSPDPTGVAYRSETRKLYVADSEVDEMSIFTGRNLFETSTGGSLAASYGLVPQSKEPTGIAWNGPSPLHKR